MKYHVFWHEEKVEDELWTVLRVPGIGVTHNPPGQNGLTNAAELVAVSLDCPIEDVEIGEVREESERDFVNALRAEETQQVEVGNEPIA